MWFTLLFWAAEQGGNFSYSNAWLATLVYFLIFFHLLNCLCIYLRFNLLSNSTLNMCVWCWGSNPGPWVRQAKCSTPELHPQSAAHSFFPAICPALIWTGCLFPGMAVTPALHVPTGVPLSSLPLANHSCFFLGLYLISVEENFSDFASKRPLASLPLG